MAKNANDTIDVKVTFTIPVSRSAWTANYYVEGTNLIKEDVRIYVENGVRDHLRDLGLLAE